MRLQPVKLIRGEEANDQVFKKVRLSERLSFCLIFVLSSVLNVAIVVASRSPSVVAGQDEVGYLAKAYALIGYPLGFASKYSSGSAFVFAPVAFVTEISDSQVAGWITLILINSVLLATSFIFARRASNLIFKIGRIGNHSPTNSANNSDISWLAVLLYAPILLTAQTTLATIPLTLVATIYIYCVLRGLHDDSKITLTSTLFAGVVAGVIHPTAVLLGAIAFIISIPVITRTASNWTQTYAFLALRISSPIVGFLIDRLWLLPVLNTKTGGTKEDLALSSSYGDGSDILWAYLEKIMKAPFTLEFYLMFATTALVYWCLTGYVPLRNAGKSSVIEVPRRSFVSKIRDVQRVQKRAISGVKETKRRDAIAAKVLMNYHTYFNLVSLMVAIGSFTLIRYTTERGRIDDWFYLRYTDPYLFIPILTCISIALGERSKFSLRAICALGALGVAIPVIADYRTPGIQDDFFYYNNTAFWPHGLGAADLWQGLPIFLVSGLVAAIFKSGRPFFLVGLLLLSVVSAVSYRLEQSSGHSRRSNLTDAAVSLMDGGCLAHDPNVPVDSQDLMGRYGLDIYRLERPSYLVFDTPNVASRVGVSAECDDFVLSYDMATEGLLLARDTFGGQGLFVTNTKMEIQHDFLFAFKGGPGRTQTIEEHISERCLRRGCFSLRGSETYSTSGTPGILNERSFVHGPYSNVAPGNWEISMSANVPDPTSLVVRLSWVVQGQREGRDLDMIWSLDEGKWLGRSTFVLESPVTLFEVVAFAGATSSHGFLDSISLLPDAGVK